MAAAPAGGAQLGQIAIVVGFVTLAYAGLLRFAHAHRQGRATLVGGASQRLATLLHMPRHAALPLALAGASLGTVYLGLMWDMSLHIDHGRDPGPLANPAHYLILLGLYGLFAAGFLALVLSPAGRRSTGGLLLAAAGTFALAGFPLDDVWHRLFGQDVTLWGPTHLIMLGGGVLSTIGVAVLLAEARVRAGRVLVCAALLVGLSAFMGEFDYGVPQFRLVLQPALIAFASGVALTAARRWAGPGAALATAATALALSLATALTVKLLGEAMPSTPLFLPAGIAVALAPRHPLAQGAATAAAVLTGEWAWTQAAMPIHWTAALLPEAAVLTLVAGLAGATLGARLGAALQGELPSGSRRAAAIALAAFAAVIADGLIEHTPARASATIAVDRGVRVRLHPAALADGAAYVRVIAWQGGAPRVQATLTHARTARRVPTDGRWKALLLVEKGRALLAAPIYEPADRAIPVGAVPARPQVTRPLVKTRDLLQRERRRGVPSWLWTGASLLVLALGLAFLLLLGWGVERAAVSLSRA